VGGRHGTGETKPGFAGLWYQFVARPLFAGLGALWLWRVVALWRLTRRIAALDLRLVASHPDGAVVLVALVFLQPFVPFARVLLRMRREARLRYGALLGRHGQLFEARWMSSHEADASLLGASEIGAAADGIELYESVNELRPFPLGLRDLVPFVAVALVPFLPVFAIEVPIRDLLVKLLKALLA
jgi:hypothetical protein